MKRQVLKRASLLALTIVFSTEVRPATCAKETWREIAYGVAARPGAPEFGGQVADSMNQTANSPAVLGLYLLIVIQSAGQIQAGNVAYFTSTDIYQIASQAWRLAVYAMGVDQMEKFRKVVYEATVATIANTAGRVMR